MALYLDVKWVHQSEHADPYRRIDYIGGNSGKFEWLHTQEQAIKAIEKNVFQYFVKVGERSSQLAVGLAPDGSKYLKTEADTDQSLLLLTLPVFSKRTNLSSD